jgi:hypothetical protein
MISNYFVFSNNSWSSSGCVLCNGVTPEPYFYTTALAGFNKLYSCYNDKAQIGIAYFAIACLVWPIGAVLVNFAIVLVYRILSSIFNFFHYACCKMNRDDFDYLRPVDGGAAASGKHRQALI